MHSEFYLRKYLFKNILKVPKVKVFIILLYYNYYCINVFTTLVQQSVKVKLILILYTAELVNFPPGSKRLILN